IITYLSGNTYSHPGQNIGIVDGELEIRKVIRTVIRDGADWVKVCTSHRTETPEYTIEELRAAVDESHRLGKKCAVHAGIEPGISMSIEAGFDTIEHGTFLTVEQAEKMKEHGQVWVPTIIAYTYAYEMVKKEIEASGKINSAVLAKGMGRVKYFEDAAFAYRDNFKKLYDTGVKIVAGTDVVVYGAPPAPVALELAYMVQYGITPVQAIQIGTSNSAEVLEMDHQIGMIREGLQADICICNGNAAEDIQKLQQVREVYLGGKSVFLERKAYL
ncbi:MAG: amidohydrolase family protein, partial [Hungatella sp.]